MLKAVEPTQLRQTANDVIEAAKDKLEDVVIVGYTKDGKEFFASTYDDGPRALWHLQRAAAKLLAIGHAEDA